MIKYRKMSVDTELLEAKLKFVKSILKDFYQHFSKLSFD